MASTNHTTHYEIPLPLGTDLTTPMDYNTAAEAVDTALFGAVTDAGNAATAAAEAVNTAEAAAGAAGDVAADLVLEKAKIVALQTRMTNVENGLGDARSDLEDMIVAFNEPTATSTHAYAIGDYFIYNDVLYKATAAIAIGDTIVPNTNCEATNVTTEIAAINSELVKGEVSVTADGTKTYTQLLNELYALVDRSKLSGNSYFTGAYGIVARCNGIQTSYIGFNSTDVEQAALKSTSFGLKPSDSFVYSFNGTTVTNNSSSVVTSGTVLKVVY